MARSVGLEVGPSAVRAVILERASALSSFAKRRSVSPRIPTAPVPAETHALTLVGMRDLPCETSNPEALTRTLAELRRTLPITTPVVLGIPSASAILATVTPLIPNPPRAALGVQFELQQQLPFDVSGAAWHYWWLSHPDGAGLPFGMATAASWIRGAARPSSERSPRQGVPALVAAMRESLLEERLACCRRAGLSVRSVTLNALAALNAWAFQRLNARPDAAPSAPSAGSSSRSPTDQADRFSDVRHGALLHLLTDRSAEWIVWTAETLQVIPVSSASPESLWEAAAVSYEALRAQASEVSAPTWVLGPSEALAPLRESLTAQKGIPVEAFDGRSSIVAGVAALEHPERSAAALGLALQGFGLGRVRLNLLTHAQQALRAQHLRRIAVMTSGVCGTLIVALGLNGMMGLRNRQLRILHSLERQERLYQTFRPEVRALIQRQEHTQQRNRQLEQLVKESTVLTQVFAQAAEALPDSAWLTTLECSKNGIVQGVLEGRATSFQDVTQLLDRLKNITGMQAVKPLSTNIVTDPVSGKELVAFGVQIQRALRLEEAAK
ncbi:MAG: PilN domain-containing protein [Candidatus Omnitrophica bacterium]|nr:PilN domain-containing protein [Candidatus Omnitrophota bacterium]